MYNQKKYNKEYWRSRTKLELKHLIIVHDIIKYFNLPIDSKILDWGAGNGILVHAFREMHIDATGYEPSDYAREKLIGLSKGYINKHILMCETDSKTIVKYDVVTCIDVFEHLNLEEIRWALEAVTMLSDNFVFSICFDSDPNFDKDPTHVTKRSKEWWKDILGIFGLEVEDAPKEWLFHNQFLICTKKKDDEKEVFKL